MNILIVGGGIGGLTLGLALKRHGLRATIVERATSIKPVGAGLTIQANATAVLEALGVNIAMVGQRVSGGIVTDESGRILSELRLPTMRHASVAVHRAELHEQLLEHVQDCLQLGRGLQDLEQQGESVTATFQDGSHENFDAVIGADGIRSRVRGIVFSDAPPRFSGYSSWRFVVNTPVQPEQPVEMWGRGVRLGLLNIGQGRVYGFATFNNPRKQQRANQLEHFHELFDSFGGLAPAVLREIRVPEQLIYTDIEELEVGEWHKGRVALLGDAAHAMTPNLGQGAGMAIEDAFVLAQHLASGRSIPDAFAQYQQARQARVAHVQRTARLLGQVGQWSIGTRLRNAILRATPAKANTQTVERILRTGPVPL